MERGHARSSAVRTGLKRALLARDGVVAAEFVVDESIEPGGLRFEPGMPTHLPRYRVHPADVSSIWDTVVGELTVLAVQLGDDQIERAPGFEGEWPGLEKP
jgi:hypothetical protein